MPEFYDLPALLLKVGNIDDLPGSPESSAYAFFARDTKQLFIADLNLQWRDVGLLTYTEVTNPTTVPTGTQITYSEQVIVTGAGALSVEGDGAVYVWG